MSAYPSRLRPGACPRCTPRKRGHQAWHSVRLQSVTTERVRQVCLQCMATVCIHGARPEAHPSMVCIHRAHPRGTSMVGVCGARPRSTDPYLSFCSCGVGGRGAGRAAHSLSLTSWMHILRRGPGLTVEGHKECVCQNHRVSINRHLGISQLSHLEPRNLSEPQLPRVCDEDELLYLHRTHLTGLAP